MQCPDCQFENPEDSNFCLECGQKLEQKCPQCGKALPVEAKFCNGCGHKLTAKPVPSPKGLSFDEKLIKIQKYLPKGLTEKILSQKDRIEGERKQVTVMFCDMEGFTQLSEKLGPEDVYTIMDKVYEILIHKVHDYEGTVNEMTGDGIMALFGAPIALEDAPQRAIRSAYSIHREMTRFSDKIKRDKKEIPPLKMRIGIHTGPVVVGTLGNDLRVEFKAVGDTVNLASRMEDLAEPGATYVTEETFKLTEGLFRFEALGEREVKGKEEPIKTYRVIGPSTRRTRFDVSAERGLTPFIGRERELELLIDGYERAKQGRGQAFSIMGEAGVGKSRLSYEFRKAVEDEDVTFLEGKCLSYSQGVAYHPIIDLYKSNFDIRENDSDDQIKEKVKRGLKQMDLEEISTLPYLLELLSVKDSGFDQINMSPEGRKDRMIEAMIRITLKGSEIRPLIMVIEDLHWMDKSSEDVLKYMLESISGARILLIFTYRPEYAHTWGGRSYHNQVNLNRLSNRESLAVVNHVLGAEDIEIDLENLILEKTEGVPFFIEEFLKSFKELKIIERKGNKYHLIKDAQGLEIPSTIQDVIMARVDSLAEGTKEVLQIGSVIEREFSYSLMKRVTRISEQVLISHLSALKDSELVYERGIFPNSTYIFKHALTQDVVSDSILTKRKKQLHENVGDAIEELFKDNIEEYYGVLTEHYIASENYEKGAQYSRLAGKKAQKAASFAESIPYAKKRISCLEKLPVSVDVQKQIIDSRSILGLYYTQKSDFVRAKEAVDPVTELALKIDYKKRLSQIYIAIGTYNFANEEDFTEAFKHLNEAIKISEERKDFVSLLLANYWMGVARYQNCEFEKAISHIKRALDINVAANSLWGIATMKSNLSGVYNYEGKVKLAYQTSIEALQIAEKSGDTFSRAMAHMCVGSAHYLAGFNKEAEEHLLKGANLAAKIDFLWGNFQTHWELGRLYFRNENYPKSELHFSQAFSTLNKSNLFPSYRNLFKLGIARTRVKMNEKIADLESLYKYWDENKQKGYQGLIAKYIAEILLNIDDWHISDAEEWINKAIEIDKRHCMMVELGRNYATYSEFFKQKNDLSKARENLEKAIKILKECGADGWVEKYEKAMAEL
ncbi:MAG: AAA family ATPase [Desulfobacterales bacterium]|nr:MAG: AAA family ATPase [Desulfobacterales bacterium]